MHFATVIFAVSGALLWLRRKSGDRARMYLFFTCLFAVFVFGGRFFGPVLEVPVSDSILPFTNISGGLLFIIILYLYPIEVINQGWLNLKRDALMLLPWMIVILMVIPYGIFIYVIPLQWMKSSATNRWITFYTITVMCIAVPWTTFMITGSPLVNSIHLLFFMIFGLGTTCQELFLRIRVPQRMEERLPMCESQDEVGSVDERTATMTKHGFHP